MKSILMSIKPEWVAKILNGEKTVEIRKTKPKCELPIDVYIYCTKGKPYLVNKLARDLAFWQERDLYAEDTLNGKVIAKFTLNNVEEIICRPICGEWESYTKTLGYSEISQASCLGNGEIVRYLKGNKGYAWHISDLEIFGEPKEISEFIKCDNNHIRIGNCFIGFGGIPRLTKAPQSWCYVEE